MVSHFSRGSRTRRTRASCFHLAAQGAAGLGNILGGAARRDQPMRIWTSTNTSSPRLPQTLHRQRLSHKYKRSACGLAKILIVHYSPLHRAVTEEMQLRPHSPTLATTGPRQDEPAIINAGKRRGRRMVCPPSNATALAQIVELGTPTAGVSSGPCSTSPEPQPRGRRPGARHRPLRLRHGRHVARGRRGVFRKQRWVYYFEKGICGSTAGGSSRYSGLLQGRYASPGQLQPGAVADPLARRQMKAARGGGSEHRPRVVGRAG